MARSDVYLPASLHIRISVVCDLACPACERELLPPTASGLRKRDLIAAEPGRPPIDLRHNMTEAQWRRIEDAWLPSTERVELGGLGEPTIAPIFPLAAQSVVSRGQQLFFFTNGRHLGADYVLDSVGETPHVSVSIDAGTPEVYSRVRGGELGQVVDNVLEFRVAKPRAKLCSQFTATADNIDDLPAFIELCARLGIGRFDSGEDITVVGASHHTTDRAEMSVRFCNDRVARALQAAQQVAERERLWMLSYLPPPGRPETRNAIDEPAADPRKILRYSDRLYGDINTFICSIEPPGEDPSPLEGSPVGAHGATHQTVNTPIYLDVSGEVWLCLARHVVGRWDTETYAQVVGKPEVQDHLRNYALGHGHENPHCNVCDKKL